MTDSLKNILERTTAVASAPCRIDMGGTLDISTFYYPLMHLEPCTFNIAINMRTYVRLYPYKKGRVKVSSKGFKSAEFDLARAPFDHPLGLMFAIAACFRADGVHIDIESTSPPRSALGGSSAAAVALVALLAKVSEQNGRKPLSRQKTAIMTHAVEESVAVVPCGLQDHLAAVFGGVNSWYWQGCMTGLLFKRKTIVRKDLTKKLEKHLIVAYCGIPHESKNVNGRWIQQFLSGEFRKQWADIISYTKKFGAALSERKYNDASAYMNRETAIRREMTPDVLDDMGEKLVESAVKYSCGARFTGAGGGGCLWAIGGADDIAGLKEIWEDILSERKGACLLDVGIDTQGLSVKVE